MHTSTAIEDIMDEDGSREVLIVEDDQGCADLIGEVINDMGYVTLACDSVCGALKILDTHRVRMVILDVMLPDGDGFAVLETIRSRTETAKLPVILCTAALFEVTGLQKPIGDSLTELVVKPFHIGSFVACVTRMLE